MMPLAFSTFMVLGRMAYISEHPWFETLKARRNTHAVCMVLSGMCFMASYIGIISDQVQIPKMFGYNFKWHAWDNSWQAIIHCWMGHVTIWLCLAQVVMGLLKRQNLERDATRSFTSHGTLGRFLSVLSWATVAGGVWMNFPLPPMKKYIINFILAIACGTAAFAPSAPRKSEQEPLKESNENQKGVMEESA